MGRAGSTASSRKGVASVRSYLDEMWGVALSRFALFAENTERTK